MILTYLEFIFHSEFSQGYSIFAFCIRGSNNHKNQFLSSQPILRFFGPLTYSIGLFLKTLSVPKNGKYNLFRFEIFTRDYDLNTVCHIRCLEETYKCIMSCESDSDCVYQCFIAEFPCLESKLSNLN